MRPGPATRAAFYADSWSSLSPHGGGMTASARQRSKPYRVPHLPEASCGPVTLRSRIHNRAVGQRPCPASCSEERGAEWGSRPQRPGNQFALARVFWIPLRQFTLENHRVAAGPAAIIRQAQELSRFAASTLRQIDCGPQHKNSVSL